jgi:uncharacterized OB-fold protein
VQDVRHGVARDRPRGRADCLDCDKREASFSHHGDYVVGIVKMPDGFNVTAWIDADLKTLKPGMKMRLVVDRRPGENYITYWFKPA